MGDISTLTITCRSVFTLRFTVKQECDMRWKFKTEGGDIGFGLLRRECVQHVQSRETVSAYHIDMPEAGDGGQEEEITKDNDFSENIIAANECQTVPEIKINDDTDNRSPKTKYRASTKSNGECALELLEEVDEIGSFVEDHTIQAETITDMKRVKKAKQN